MNKNLIMKLCIVAMFLFLFSNFIYENKVKVIISELGVQQEEIAQKTFQLSKLKQFKNTEVIQKEIDSLNENLEKLNSKIPADDNTSDTILYLYNLCRKYNIKGNSINFETSINKKEKYNTTKISISGEGNYLDILNFMKVLQLNTNRIVNIDNIKLTPANGNTYLFKLMFVTYTD